MNPPLVTGSRHAFHAKADTPHRADVIFCLLSLNTAMSRNDAQAVYECGTTLASALSAEDKNTVPPVVESILWLAGNSRQDQAEKILDAGLAKLPGQSDLLSLKADLLFRQNRQDEAVELIRTAVEKDPDSVEGKLLYISALNQAGHSQEAFELLKRIPDGSLSPELRFTYAQMLNIQGNFSESERQLRRALQEKPSWPEAGMLLGLTLERLKKNGEACETYEKVLEEDPDNGRCLLLLLRLYLKEGNMERAIGLVLESGRPVKYALSAATVLMDEKQYGVADAFLEKLEFMEPLSSDLYFEHASLLFQHGTGSERALSLLDKIDEEHTDYFPALGLKVLILISMKKEEEARKFLEAAVQDHPGSTEYLLTAADSFLAMKDDARAEAYYKKVLQLKNDHPFAMYQIAFLQDQKGNRRESLKQMESLLRKHPEHASALNFVAYALAEESRDLDKALRYATKAVSLEPHADYIADTLAWVHYKRHEYQKAWETIQKALELHLRSDVHDPVLIEHVGDIALKVHNDKTAADAWTEAMKLYRKQDQESDAERVRSKLEKMTK